MNWLVTSTAREHELTGTAAIHPDNVPSLGEIGHSLAQINRFTGHATRPYSVAEHSLLVLSLARNEYASTELQYAALMHDAHECITNDVASPIKAELGSAWTAFEWKHQRHLLEQYELLDVFTQYKARIKRWDLIALATERAQITRFNPLYSRLWPILDTPGEEIPVALDVDLNAQWRRVNTWATWAHVFTQQAEELQTRLMRKRLENQIQQQ
jgi:hypothetical protein